MSIVTVPPVVTMSIPMCMLSLHPSTVLHVSSVPRHASATSLPPSVVSLDISSMLASTISELFSSLWAHDVELMKRKSWGLPQLDTVWRIHKGGLQCFADNGTKASDGERTNGNGLLINWSGWNDNCGCVPSRTFMSSSDTGRYRRDAMLSPASS